MVTARRASLNVAFWTHREEVVSDVEVVVVVGVLVEENMVELGVSSGVASDLKFPSRSSQITTE